MSKASSKDRAAFWDQIHALYPLVRDGARPYDDVRPAIQRIIEGDFGDSVVQPSDGPSGLFVTPDVQTENLRGWNEEFGWGIPKKAFAELGDAPLAPTGGLTVWMLVPYLKGKRGVGGVQRTFDGLWSVIASRQPKHWRWDELKSDQEHLRLLPGIEHQPGLRWEKIDLAANRNMCSRDVRSPESSPHAGVLAAAAHFPEWIRAMDGKDVPYVEIPGYQVNVDDDVEWRSVPDLSWDEFSRKVRLDAISAGDADPLCAVPVLRECQS